MKTRKKIDEIIGGRSEGAPGERGKVQEDLRVDRGGGQLEGRSGVGLEGQVEGDFGGGRLAGRGFERLGFIGWGRVRVRGEGGMFIKVEQN